MTIQTIFVNQNTPDTCYFTVGSKPYPKPQISQKTTKGGFLSTTGSFQLSSGGGRRGMGPS